MKLYKFFLGAIVFLFIPIAFAISASNPIFSDVATSYNTGSPVPENSLGQITLTDTGGANGNIALNIFVDYFGSKLYLTFRNEATGALIDDKNITLNVISPISETHIVTTGYLTVNITQTGLYQFQYEADTYMSGNDFINIPDFQDLEKTLYLLESANGNNVSVIILDEYRKPLEGAYVKVLRLDIPTGNYVQVQTARTNFDGQTQINAVLNSVFYQFIIEYPFGTVRTTTAEETNIYENTITFQISIEDLVGSSFFNANGINKYLEFNNDTNEFSLTFSDENNEDQYVCLEAYRTKLSGSSLVNSTCVTSASGLLKVGVDNITGAIYTAKAFVTTDRVILDELTFKFPNDTSIGRLGLLMIIFITILFIFVAVWDISVGLILIPLPQLFGAIIGVIDIAVPMAISLEIIFLVLAIWVSRRRA